MSMDLPTNWTEMNKVEQTEIMLFKNWSYDPGGYDNNVVGGTNATGEAKFDFLVRPYINAQNTAEVDEENKWAVNFTYQIENISGPTRGFDHSSKPTQRDFMKEMLMLSYASKDGTRGRLPARGDSVFGVVRPAVPPSGDDPGTPEIQVEPVIDTISLNQAGQDPNVWHMNFKSKKIKYGSWTTTKSEPTVVPDSQYRPKPWELPPTISASASTEPYVLGVGYNCGKIQASSLTGDYLNSGSSSPFLSTGKSPEIVQNTAGDPFRSPPAMKVAVTTFTIEKAFELNKLINFGSEVISAMTTVNKATIQMTGNNVSYTIPAGCGMMSGFTVSNGVVEEQVDWLPRQKHPLGLSYNALGWSAPSNKSGTSVAVNTWGEVLKITSPPH